MSSAVISRSGGFCLYGSRVFGPARTIRLCQCRSDPEHLGGQVPDRVARLGLAHAGRDDAARLDGGEQLGRLGLRVQQPGRADALVLDQALS